MITIKDDGRQASCLTKLLSTKETAKLLGVSERSVYNYAKSGELPAIWLGKQTKRFALADIEVFVAKARSERRAG